MFVFLKSSALLLYISLKSSTDNSENATTGVVICA